MTDNQFSLDQVVAALTVSLRLDQCVVTEPHRDGETALPAASRDEVMRIPIAAGARGHAEIVGFRRGDPLSQREQRIVAVLPRVIDAYILASGHPAGAGAAVESPDASGNPSDVERVHTDALLRATQVVARQEDLDATLETILVELERIITLDTASIVTVDYQGSVLVPRVTRFVGERVREHLAEVPFDRGLIGAAFQSGEPIHVLDAHLDPRSFYPDDYGPLWRLFGESMMLAPLSTKREIVGVIYASRVGSPQFSDLEFRLFRLFAAQVESALYRALTLQAERDNRQIADRIVRLAIDLGSAQTEHEVALPIADATREILGTDSTWVGLFDEDGACVVEVFATANEHDAAEIAPVLVAPTSGATEPVVVSRYDDVSPVLRQRIAVEDFSGAVLIPLRHGSSAIGEIWSWSPGTRPRISPGSRSYLETLVTNACVTLVRIREREIPEALDRMADTLTRASQIALGTDRDEDAVRELVELLVTVLPTDAATAWLIPRNDAVGRPAQVRLAAVAGTSASPSDYDNDDFALDLIGLHEKWFGRMMIVPDVEHSRLSGPSRRHAIEINAGALIVLPLVDAERLYGFVRLDYANAHHLPDIADIVLAKGIVDQFGVRMGALRLHEQWMDLYRSSIEALAATVDAKDPFTHMHSRNVAYFSRLLAEEMGLSDDEVQQVELAGLLHDIGKIGIADQVLIKDGPLDPRERMEMMAHPERGAQILSGHEGLTALVPIVRHHHERYDGRGYPDGLKGNEIPRGAAIVAAADAFDTIINERSYARGRSFRDARGELQSGAGTQFDPLVVRNFTSLIDERLDLIKSRKIELPRDHRYLRGDHLPVAEIAQVRVISRLSQELRLLTDLDSFVRSACDIVARELGYSTVEIHLADPKPGGPGSIRAPGRATWRESFVRRVLESGQIINISDIAFYPDFDVDLSLGSILAAPLIVDNESIGVLFAAHQRRAAFSIVDESLISVAANQMAAALRVAQLHDQVKWTARHDALTGALNHGAFYAELQRAIDDHTNHAQPASLILCDVEGLKRVNDRLGHLVGDDLLRSLVERLRSIVRDSDMIARYGGDEFAIITIGTSREEAARTATQIRASLDEKPLLEGIARTQVTIGIAQIGEDGPTPSELVKVADDRLYQERGRRRGHSTMHGDTRELPRLPDSQD